jgi:ABC-type uncharacterized transport system permease subunit
MIPPALSGLIAILIYLSSSLWQWLFMSQGRQVHKGGLRSLALLALVAHGLSTFPLVHTPAGVNLGFFQVSSLMFWVMCVVLLVSSLKLPVENLFALLFPLSALSVACSLLLHSAYTPEAHITLQIGWHILISILAYSLLSIAAFQALALGWQDHLLRSRHFQGLLRVLPPLQTMEALLFEMLWAGTTLLTLSLGTGFLFFEDIRGQHLSHKMAFSSMAWLIYVILLWGRHTRGWHGRKAIHWTLGGFVALMLAYFGSKFVLELILA